MRHVHGCIHQTSQSQGERLRARRQSLRSLTLVGLILATLSAFGIQNSPALHATSRGGPSSPAARKHQVSSSAPQSADDSKQLMDELIRLQKKLEQGVQFPAPRTQSRLLPLLPSSSSFFVGLPNYGEALHQASQIFHQELQESPVLNSFWQAKVGMAGLIADEVIEKVYQLSQFLGDEIVVSGTVNAKSGSVLIIAEARKPGLKAFIQQLVDQYAGKTKPPVRVYTPEQLALAKTQPHYTPFLILVRPDFVVASSELAALRSFNAQLNRGGVKFTSSPFGEKIAHEYQNGAAVVFAADLHQLLSLRPHGNAKDEAVLNQTGFADLKYLVGEGQYAGGIASSTAELSFAGPRKGIAGWLAAPAPLTGLDFISPDAAYVVALNLKNFGQVFDDIKSIAESSNPMADAGLAQVESELKINLKEDLFSKLSGQIVAALDGPIMPEPAWKVVVQLVDSNGLEHTLKQLIAMAGTKLPEGIKIEQASDGRVNYYSVRFPGAQKPVTVECAFADGFLVVGGSHAMVKDAIEIRRSRNSLAKSSEFQQLLPREQANGASGIIYQDLAKIMGPLAEAAPPDQAQLFELISKYGKPTATSFYGSEDAIRFTGKSSGLDPSALLIAAIAIPNLMRSKNAANEAAAAANVRTLVAAEATYSITFEKRGFAPDLATLGRQPDGTCADGPSESHACAIDSDLGCGQTWCVHSAFRFNITGSCKGQVCDDYVIVATPLNTGQGSRSFCATSDGVVRGRRGDPLADPISVAECQSWEPL